jgi:hypothetical protein
MKKNLSVLLLTLAAMTSISALADDALKGATAVQSPFKGVCEDMVMISNHDYQMQKAYWDQVQANCSAQLQAQVLPGAEFLSSMSEKLMTQGAIADNKSAADFLKKVGERARDGIDYNNKVTEVIEACANHQTSAQTWFKGQQQQAKALEKDNPELSKFDQDLYDDSKCDDRLSQLKDTIKEKGADFRINMEMARRTASLSNKAASGARKLGDWAEAGLSAVGIGKGSGIAAEKVPLSSDEKAQADKMEAELNQRAIRDTKKAAEEGARKMDEILAAHPEMSVKDFHDPSVPDWVVKWVQSSRSDFQMQEAVKAYKAKEFDKYFANYSKALGDARILAFLDKRDPSNSDIALAAQKLMENGAASKKDVEALLAAGAKPGLSDSQRADAMVGLLQYGGSAADLLKEDKSQCRVATALSNHIATADAKTQAMIGAGLLAAGLAAPFAVPAIAAAAGVSISASAVAATAAAVSNAYAWGTVGQDYAKYQAAKARTFNYATAATGRAVADVGSVQDTRNAFATNLAIQSAFAATSAIPPMYRKYMAEMNAKPKQTIDALKAAGMTDAGAKKVVADLGSKDPEVSKAAAASIAKMLGVDEKEVNGFKKIVQKQLLDPNARLQYDTYASRLAAVKDPEQRAKLLDNMNKILDEFPDALNPNKRTDAMRVALAASDLGVDVPTAKQLAAHVKDWDDKGSLYGLARALDKAAEMKRMDPHLSNDEAFLKGLTGELGVSDKAVAEQMCRCANLCAAK